MRTIELHLDESDLQHIAENTTSGALSVAITRLTTWGLDSYGSVKIFRDGKDSDLIAVYTGSGSISRFVIGAVYNKGTGTYSFHS